MANAQEQKNFVESLLDVFTRLTNGLTDEDIRVVRHLAADEGPAEVWLQTSTLSHETRICLMASVAYALRSLKNDPYKCAVFSRDGAKALLSEKESGA